MAAKLLEKDSLTRFFMLCTFNEKEELVKFLRGFTEGVQISAQWLRGCNPLKDLLAEGGVTITVQGITAETWNMLEKLTVDFKASEDPVIVRLITTG